MSRPCWSGLTPGALNDKSEHDLAGGPSAGTGSDIGMREPQVVEFYDIESWASDHFRPVYRSALFLTKEK